MGRVLKKGSLEVTKSIEAVYGVKKRRVKLYRRTTKSGKKLDVFDSPGKGLHVLFNFPEFTCLCPRTGHPDFADITFSYLPVQFCVEMKSLKYYYNSFRNEGHFHEQVTRLIAEDLVGILRPEDFWIRGIFNTRGGTTPTIQLFWADGKWY